MRLVSLLSAASIFSATACTTDVKGNSCGFLDSFDDDGTTYCPDPEAPEDCEDMKSAIVDSFVECGLEEETAQQEVDDALSCEAAVATTTDFDACVDRLSEECTLELPDECDGVVIFDRDKL